MIIVNDPAILGDQEAMDVLHRKDIYQMARDHFPEILASYEEQKAGLGSTIGRLSWSVRATYTSDGKREATDLLLSFLKEQSERIAYFWPDECSPYTELAERLTKSPFEEPGQ